MTEFQVIAVHGYFVFNEDGSIEWKEGEPPPPRRSLGVVTAIDRKNGVITIESDPTEKK